MKKILWTVTSLALFINAAVIAGLLLWLTATNRLDGKRIHNAVEIFKPTRTEEKKQQEMAKKLEEEAKIKARETARLLSVGSGPPVPIMQQLAAQAQDKQILEERLDRLQRERQDLLRQLELAKEIVAKQGTDLDSKRKSLDQVVQTEARQRDDRDFQAAIQLFEQIKPKQIKEIFQDLIRQDKIDAVVDYLAAMQLRKTAAIIKEFKTPEEISQATELIQRLRMRGVEPLKQAGVIDSPPTMPQPVANPNGAS